MLKRDFEGKKLTRSKYPPPPIVKAFENDILRVISYLIFSVSLISNITKLSYQGGFSEFLSKFLISMLGDFRLIFEL